MMPESARFTNAKIKPHGFRKGGVLFVSIPKNNSTIIRKAGCFNIKRNRRDQYQDDAPVCFAVIRDPAARVWSGVGEWIRRKRPDSKLTVDEVLKHFDLWREEFDEHLERQEYFLPTRRIHLFRFDRQDEVVDFLARNGCALWATRLNRLLKATRNCPARYVERATEIAERHYSGDLRLWRALDDLGTGEVEITDAP